MKSIILLYIPVIHQGYLQFLAKHRAEAQDVYVLGEDLIDEFLAHKEIRAIASETAAKAVEALGFSHVHVATKANLSDLNGAKIITANEEIIKKIIDKYLSGSPVEYDKIFLRWDEGTVKSDHLPAYDRVSEEPFDREMTVRAANEGDKSSDWWRHVGAVLVKDGKVILESHNQHTPSEHTQYTDGDPRDVLEAGKLGFLSTAIHAEQAVVSEAAKRGISIEGASIYMNVFPCLVCARIIAFAGIKKCYFRTGNAYLNVEEALKSRGVEIVLVK